MYATADEVAANIGRPLTPAEQVQVITWIRWAEATIASKMGNLAALDPDALNMVVVEAVTRRLRMPDPVTQVDVQVDDGSVSKRFASSSGLIEILPEWWAALGWAGAEGAFSITPYGERDRVRL